MQKHGTQFTLCLFLVSLVSSSCSPSLTVCTHSLCILTHSLSHTPSLSFYANNCPHLRELPPSLHRLKRLRWLNVSNCDVLDVPEHLMAREMHGPPKELTNLLYTRFRQRTAWSPLNHDQWRPKDQQWVERVLSITEEHPLWSQLPVPLVHVIIGMALSAEEAPRLVTAALLAVPKGRRKSRGCVCA